MSMAKVGKQQKRIKFLDILQSRLLTSLPDEREKLLPNTSMCVIQASYEEAR